MDKQLLEIYSDYLIISFFYITAAGLSAVLDNEISHDKTTRFLSSSELMMGIKGGSLKYKQKERERYE